MARLPISSDLEYLRAAPRKELGRWPTPLDLIRSRQGTLWVKRDDLSGFGRGGVKTRKIEHLLSWVAERGYREIVTPVANVTNLAHDLGTAEPLFDLSAKVLVVDHPRLPAHQRQGAFEGAGAAVSLLGPSRFLVAARLAGMLVSGAARRRGTFMALPSLSHPHGIAGPARGFLEMVEQMMEQYGVYPEAVFITAASGATCAGFLLAARALVAAGMPPIRVVGVQVHEGPIGMWIRGLIEWSQRKLPLAASSNSPRIQLLEEELHGGFGRFPRSVVEVCRRVHEQTGLRVDPIFGGKTWCAMERMLQRRRLDGPVVYWHCGYTPDWEALALPDRMAHEAYDNAGATASGRFPGC